MDVEIERSLARWDRLARLDTSWMCWLELITTLPPWWWWPGSDLDLAAGRTAMSTSQPGAPVFVDRAGDQARPGMGKMRTPHTSAGPVQVLAGSWLTLAGRPGGLDGSWSGTTGARRTRGRKRRRLVGRLFPLAGGVEIGRTRQREVWPLTTVTSNYSPSRGHPESPHTK